jgi:hypothetical protein
MKIAAKKILPSRIRNGLPELATGVGLLAIEFSP